MLGTTQPLFVVREPLFCFMGAAHDPRSQRVVCMHKIWKTKTLCLWGANRCCELKGGHGRWMPGSIDGMLGHGSKVHRGRGVAIWKMKTLWMSGLCSIGLVMDPKFTRGGRWHVEDVNSVDARVVEQAIICLTLGPLWLKVQIWLWLRPSHSFVSPTHHPWGTVLVLL